MQDIPGSQLLSDIQIFFVLKADQKSETGDQEAAQLLVITLGIAENVRRRHGVGHGQLREPAFSGGRLGAGAQGRSSARRYGGLLVISQFLYFLKMANAI